MSRLVLVCALSALALASSGCVPDIRPTPGKAHQMVKANWKTLGERAFDFQSETETFELGKHEGGYAQLSLRVQTRAVHIEVVEVIHEKDTTRYELGATVAAGQGSQVIKVETGHGVVKSVRVTYRDPSPPAEGEGESEVESARVTLHGRN